MALQPIDENAASSSDRDFLVRKSLFKGYQYASLASPILYTSYALATKRGFNLNRVLRATWIGGVAGIALGGGIEYARSTYNSNDALRIRRVNAMYDRFSLRAEDHSTIGALLGAALTPAIFLKRARKIHLFLGGAGIGAAVGLLVHFTRRLEHLVPPTTSSRS